MENAIVQERLHPNQLFMGYSDEKMPLGSYAFLVGVFHLMVFGLSRVADKKNPKSSGKIGIKDLLLLQLATHKLSRIITKDWVTSPFRAPFTEYQGSAGGGEIKEKPRGSGFKRAMGDLLTCQYCIGPWVSALAIFSFFAKPRLTRQIASTFALVAGSDFLHFTYQAARAKQSQVKLRTKELMH